MNTNTGVIIKEPTRERSTSGVPSLFNYTADWRGYESAGEWQKDMTIGFDTEACMSFAANDSLQTYLNWLIANGQILPAQLDFLKNNQYLDSQGKVALSDRFTAYMSGTTTAGNDFENVWGSIEKNGVIPASLWPFPEAEMDADPGNAWNIYYTHPTAAAVSCGTEFLKFFQPDWHWLVSNGQGASTTLFQTWLETAPIHLAIEVCPPWNTALPIQGCGGGAQHGVMLAHVDTDGTAEILDHYVPFQKIFAPGYTLSYAVQGWVNQIPQTDNTAVITNLTQQVSILQKIVSLLKGWLSTHPPKQG